MKWAPCITLALALALGCHQQPAASRGSASHNVITREEIEASGAKNVYDVIAQLRGNFLSDRGPISIKSNVHSRAIVFLNDQEYGIPETMRNIPPERIAEIRYYPGTDAVTRYGAQYGGGVILLISRTQ